MHTFTDNQDRSWTIRVDVNAIKRVRKILSLDLNRLMHDKELLIEIAQDTVLLVDLLYVLVEDQCKAKNVTDTDFGSALVGDAIDAASEALLKAIIDFFPMRRRKALQAALEAANKGQKLAMDKLDEAISKGIMDRQIEKELTKIDQEIAKIFAS
jgi:hypothetical protein